MRFDGKSVVLTGASAGIGRALAIELARRGSKLTLASRGRDALDEVAEACARVGPRPLVVPTDVTDPDACKAMVDAAVRAHGGLDVLINNAGVSQWARFDEITDLSLFERLMRVNYLGAVYCTHHALPHVRARQGLLVAISSLTGKTGVPARSGYAASKHAMQGFFDSLRIELRHTGVGVLVVSPGFVATGIRDRALGPDGKPIEESPREENARSNMSVEECVAITVRAMEQRKREVVMTRQAQLGMWAKLFAPSVVDRMAAKAIGDRGK